MSSETPSFFKTLEQQLKKENDTVNSMDLSKIGFGSIIAKTEDKEDKKKLKFLLVWKMIRLRILYH